MSVFAPPAPAPLLPPVSDDRIRVVVADDHPLFREALVRAVKQRPELELVAACADGREALEAIRAERPAVAVVDVRMPELDGLRVLNAVERDALGTRIVLLSAFTDGPLVFDAFAAGAAAYLAKDADRDAVADAIVAVARGGTIIPPEVQAEIAAQIRARGREERPVLTPRELEVLTLVGEGLQAPDIGRRLHLSPATVKGHLASVYEKLGVSDRAAAVREGMRRGLLE